MQSINEIKEILSRCPMDALPARMQEWITSYNSSRFFAESFLESFTPSILHSCGRITAAATTGPAKGPLPTSSIPATSA